MTHLSAAYTLSAVLIGIGVYGVLARRNAVLVLVGVELILGGATVLLVASAGAGHDRWASGTLVALFVITVAAAEIVVALAVVLAAFRIRGRIDVTEPRP